VQALLDQYIEAVSELFETHKQDAGYGHKRLKIL
jgi:hypothetical protein